ncbi:MAG: hypothetical protein GY838_12795 [bacterium]|nr:hypothetical protein [bacterium]
MTAIPTTFGSGGANLAPGGAAGTPTLADTLREIADDVANQLAASSGALNVALSGRVYHGGLVTDPSTPSAQLTGASGNTTWSVNVSAAEALVNSVDGVIAASADEAIHASSNLLDAVGKSCYAAVVLAESGGTIAIDSVKAAAAVTASAVAPTVAQITAGVGHANWIYLAMCLITRSADTAVVQVQTNVGYGKPALPTAALTTKA